MMKRILTALFLLLPVSAFAQGSGQLQSGQVWGNPKATTAPATGTSFTAMFDRALCATQGALLTRTTGWVCLSPGTVGLPLVSAGAGANLAYSILTVAGGGTGRATLTNHGLLVGAGTSNITQLGVGGANFPLIGVAASDPAFSTIAWLSSAISGGVGCFTSTTQMASSALLTANALVVGGGAGVCPSPLGSLGTTTTVLHGNAGGAPTYSAVAYADINTSDIASLAQYLAGTSSKLVQAGVIYTAETTTTFASNAVTLDFSTFINTAITLSGGNLNTMNVSNVTAGKAGSIAFIQDGTGSRTTVWNSIFKFAGGATPILSTTANAIDVLFYSCRSATNCPASLTKDVR